MDGSKDIIRIIDILQWTSFLENNTKYENASFYLII